MGYAPVFTIDQQPAGLTDAAISAHLNGSITIGIYPLLKDNSSYFIAADFDHGDWLQEANRYCKSAASCSVPAYIERSRSGDGAHVWIFFQTNIPAVKARQLGHLLLERAGITRRQSYDRLFPSQDFHTGQGLGNLIALPLQGDMLKTGKTAFVNEHGDSYPDQWRVLKAVTRVTESTIDRILGAPKMAAKKPGVHSAASDEGAAEPMYRAIVGSPVELVLGSQIYIPAASVSAQFYQFLKSRLNFSNPRYLEYQRNGYSTHAIPRYITTIEKSQDGILVPAGFLPEISAFAEKTKLKLTFDDQQAIVPVTRLKSSIKLRPEQRRAADNLLAKPRSILEAGPGFGKTIVGLYCLSKLRQKTLIIVHTRELLEQWATRIHECFDLKDGDLGIIGEGKWQVGRKITLASYQTLNRRCVEDIRSTFGLVIIDECHHAPAKTFTNVLKIFEAKYVLGLTATAMRRDQLDRMMEFYIGPILRVSSKPQPTGDSKFFQQPTTVTSLVVKTTDFEPAGLKNSEFHEVAAFLIADNKRNAMIADDITTALGTDAKCLVLTERVEHCQILLDQVRQRVKGTHAAIVTGKNTRKERAALRRRLTQERFKLLISTGKLIGEGFGWPELTHLFLVFPFTYKGKVVQYVGRLQRTTTESPQQTFVYDYSDLKVPMLKAMYFKRLRSYRSLGIVRQPVGKRKRVVSADQISLF